MTTRERIGGDATQRIGEGASPRSRHCMVLHSYYPRVAPRTQRQAERLVEAGYAVDVICLRDRGEPARERYGGVEIHRLPVRLDNDSLPRQLSAYLRFFALASARLTRLHLAEPYGTVHVHNLPDFLVFSALVPKLQEVPVILDLHDLMPEFYRGRFGSKGGRALTRLIELQERLSCRFADHVITVSEHWKRALIGRGVPASKCTVVMNVADERVFAPRTSTADPSEFRLIYHGTVAYRYGLDLALRAVAMVRRDIPEIRLTIIGVGDQWPEIIRLSRELDLEDVVDLRPDAVRREELPGIIASADVGIVPSRNDEFTDSLVPTKLMELAVMGMPCIAASTTAIRDYFGGAMVELFEPGNAHDLARCIRQLHRNRPRPEELAASAASFTRQRSWGREGAGFVDLVDGLARRPAPTGGGYQAIPR
jgi:glycosyltransferase involved in cell wall biosynthesis